MCDKHETTVMRQHEAADGGKTGIPYAGWALTDGGDDKLTFVFRVTDRAVRAATWSLFHTCSTHYSMSFIKSNQTAKYL